MIEGHDDFTLGGDRADAKLAAAGESAQIQLLRQPGGNIDVSDIEIRQRGQRVGNKGETLCFLVGGPAPLTVVAALLLLLSRAPMDEAKGSGADGRQVVGGDRIGRHHRRRAEPKLK